MLVAKCQADSQADPRNFGEWYPIFEKAMEDQGCRYLDIPNENDNIDGVPIIAMNTGYAWEWDPMPRFNPVGGDVTTARLWSWKRGIELIVESMGRLDKCDQ